MRFFDLSRVSGSVVSKMSLLFVLGLAACGGDDNGGGSGGTGPEPEPEDDAAMLAISNQTDIAIESVKLRLCGIGGSWGSNILGNDPISGGETQSMEVPIGCYDVSVYSDPALDLAAYKANVIFIAGATKTLNLPGWPASE